MEDRIIELETRVAYQAKLLSDLDEVVLGFGKLLDELVVKIRLLEERQRESHKHDMEPHNTPPPHY